MSELNAMWSALLTFCGDHWWSGCFLLVILVFIRRFTIVLHSQSNGGR